MGCIVFTNCDKRFHISIETVIKKYFYIDRIYRIYNYATHCLELFYMLYIRPQN